MTTRIGVAALAGAMLMAGHATSASAEDSYRELGRAGAWHVWTDQLDNGHPFCSLSADLDGGRSFDIGKFFNHSTISVRMKRTGWHVRPGTSVTLQQTYTGSDVWRLSMSGLEDDLLVGEIPAADVLRYLQSLQNATRTTIAFSVNGKPPWQAEAPWTIDIADGERVLTLFAGCINTVMRPVATAGATQDGGGLPPARLRAPAFQPFAR